MVLEHIITSLNYNPIKAFSGFEALEILKNQSYKLCLNSNCPGLKLALMDYQMPIMDGVETTKKIINFIKNKQLTEFPIIACTAFNGKEELEKCFNAGMVDIVIKPINAQTLKKIINKYIENKIEK